MSSPIILGHRGASAYRPENTLESYALAMEQGADGIELDIHLSKDGEVVVVHDETLERVSNGTGMVKDYTLAELKEFNFNKLFPEHTFITLPTLKEVYQMMASNSGLVNVELKTNVVLYPGLAEKALELEKSCGMSGRIIYSSFNHYTLLEIRQNDPEAKIGLLYNMGMVDPWVYAKHLDANFLHPPWQIVGAYPETVAQCQERGIGVNVWTVDEPQIVDMMLAAGVDGIMTNHPDVVISHKGKKV